MLKEGIKLQPVVSLSNHGLEDTARPSTGLRTREECVLLEGKARIHVA